MSDSNYIEIFTGDLLVVQKIISELEKHDIIPVIKDETDSGLSPIFGASNAPLKQVSVHKDELDKARIAIEAITSNSQN
ncbi:MAG: DUF2007 domain-containing protein [Algibacter sp.]|uniref:DUF2007 domain-containing protein n=1 Tax=Algibacter sp. TaxID=1872428 RepID=UPI0026379201|nr:DUF2007 domain-containing protein [Algibacter sp.]MDG1730447.1 DUF2007 domain-containing protein [Algibacter sp.]MDG2177381.1 DUF2007 domain-containing protein [Algibacter sp.]